MRLLQGKVVLVHTLPGVLQNVGFPFTKYPAFATVGPPQLQGPFLTGWLTQTPKQMLQSSIKFEKDKMFIEV